MSMPSSEIAVTSSVTDATSQLQTNPSEKTHKSTQLLDTSQNSGLNLNRCSCPRPSTTASRYSKQNRNNNPVPSTSKVDIERDEESLDCPNSPDPCASSCLPLSQAKSYICSCNPIDDPKPGPSTSAAEFDLEVFDSCSSCSLEDCWGPDCHHSSCESSPIASSTNTSVLIRSTGKNKTFHRKGNKRQLNSSGIPESSKPSSGLNNGDSSSEVFSVNHSKPRPSVYRQNFIDHSKTTLGEFSDNSSEEDFIMSSPGRALPTHVGQDYEPTSACPSETEEANLSDGREDDVEENDGSLYQKGTQNQYPRHNTNSLQEISNETSMDDINHDEVNQLTDVEEEGEQDGEIINASVFRDTISTSNISHNPELQKESRHYVNSGTECVQVEAESQTEDSEEHCNCYRQKSGPSPILPTAYYESASQCQEGLVLTTCHCSQMSTSDGILHIHDEKSRENHLVPSNLLNADPASMISCKSTTDYAHLGESLNSAHYPDDERKEHTQKTSAISSQKDPDAMSSSSVNPPAGDIDSHLNERSNEERTLTKTVTENTSKNSPLPSTSASATIASPQLPHCMCHSHVHHHHIHHHTPIHPPMSQRDVTVTNESTQIHSDKEPNIGGMESDTPLQKTPHKPLSSEKPLSGSSRSIKSPNRTIRGTTQDAMTADNVDEIVHDHDLFGTDENEDSLDSVATLSLNETTPSQEDEEASTTISFQFDIKIKESMDSMASTLNVLDADESSVENNLDTSGGLSGTKRKPDECAEDVSGPSNIKKKRTVPVSRRNSNAKCQASSLLNSTPKSAPRTSHINQVSIGTRCVSDVNMASAAFHLDDEKDHDNEEGGKPHNETQNSKEERNGGRNAGRQRYWSAGTLNTEEEICAGTTNAENKYCANIAHTKSDSLDIVPGLSTCETVALALPCSISASKNMFANVHNLCPSTNFCCKCRNEACPIASSSEEICLSDIEEKNTANISSLGTSISCPIRANTEKHDTIPFYTKQGDVDCCDVSESKCYNSNRSFHPSPSILYGSSHEAICCNNLQVSPSTQQQLTKLIPDKNYPPEDILDWKDSFSRWSNAKRLLAIDQLISMCEPQQVRHMMAVIEPQFQRDFISLLPKELSLYVLSFLKPRDLLNAAQTCRYWRILAEDNLLWREKCRESGLGDSVAEMFNARAKAHCKRGSNLSGIDYSSWKLGYMREHNIECNWRVKPIRTTKVLKGHDDHVITCLQFSNNKIVSGSDDNTLKVWNASTGRCLRTLVGHTGGVWSSQMEGNTIVSGSTDRSLKVWNADTGECVHTLYGHTSTVRCMHLHNNLVVSGSRDATLRMWDISSGECLHVLMGHVAAVRCVQYDGRLVVSGAYDYMVKVWNPITEECLHTLSGHTNRVYSLQFDGVHVVSGSLDTSIRVWDVETGSCKHALMGHQSLTSGMELKDNILVSGNADSTVKVWDITNGQCLQTLSGPNKHQSAVTCLQFDSKFVVTSSDDGTVKLWDVKTGEFIRDLVALKSGGSGGVVWRIRASPTKLVCAVGSRNGTEETKLLVLDFDAPLEK